jgi:hypothetical protein
MLVTAQLAAEKSTLTLHIWAGFASSRVTQ